MYKKKIEMTYEQAAKIASDMLDVLEAVYEIYPLSLCTSIENGETTVKTFEFSRESVTLKTSFTPRVNGEYCGSNLYKIVRNNRHFEITLFNEPDELGYVSILPFTEYDPETYVVFDIVEKRFNGNVKYEMVFGIDIEKGMFLELFELVYYNANDILREYPNLNSRLETELKNTVIF